MKYRAYRKIEEDFFKIFIKSIKKILIGFMVVLNYKN